MRYFWMWLICLYVTGIWAHEYRVTTRLRPHSIVLSFKGEVEQQAVGCRLDMEIKFLQHPDFEGGRYGKIILAVQRTDICRVDRQDWGHVTLQRGAELPGLVWGPYELIINGKFLQIIDWSRRADCTRDDSSFLPCF